MKTFVPFAMTLLALLIAQYTLPPIPRAFVSGALLTALVMAGYLLVAMTEHEKDR